MSPSRSSNSLRLFYNECWKESRGKADWVFITNIDEHLYHPSLAAYLEACRSEKVTLIPALGYQMIAHEFPAAGQLLCEAATRGAPWAYMNKLSVFDPNAIEEMNFTAGRHVAQPVGKVRFPRRDELLNLHYKYLGRAYTRRRHGELGTRLLVDDVKNAFGFQYLWNDAQLDEDWREQEARSVDVADPKLEPGVSHGEPRWWRTGAAKSL